MLHHSSRQDRLVIGDFAEKPLPSLRIGYNRLRARPSTQTADPSLRKVRNPVQEPAVFLAPLQKLQVSGSDRHCLDDRAINWTISGMVARLTSVRMLRSRCWIPARTWENSKEEAVSAIGCGSDRLRQEVRERAGSLPIGACCSFTSARSCGR
jgi:hypothetical protein